MEKEVVEDDFLRAFLVTLGYMALFTLFLFIPLIGFVLAFTLGPYIAGYRGGRYTVEWKKAAFGASFLWTSILIIIIIFLVLPMFPMGFELKIGGQEMLIIALVYAVNILFCAFGAMTRFKERATYV